MDPTLSARVECFDQYRLDYDVKRKADNRDRVRQCRARKAARIETQNSLIAGTMDIHGLGAQDASYRTTHRISSGLAREFALIVASRLQNYDPIIQHLTIEKFLGQELLLAS